MPASSTENSAIISLSLAVKAKTAQSAAAGSIPPTAAPPSSADRVAEPAALIEGRRIIFGRNFTGGQEVTFLGSCTLRVETA